MSDVTLAGGTNDGSATDLCLPFFLDGGAFRGRLVRLTHTVTDILACHNDPQPVAHLLAEAMLAAVALASGLKYDGVFTLQIQGRGAIHTLVTDITSAGDVRGCAKFDLERVNAETEVAHPHLLGVGGHLAFTVDQGPKTERFQGIVELSGDSITEAVHNYFRQSEQIDSALKMAIAPALNAGEPWRAAAIVIQRMPPKAGAPSANSDESDEEWRTAVILLGSLKDSELLDWGLAPERLLTRLYATLGVVASARRPIRAKCRCSYERSERILASFPVDEIRSFAQNGEIHMACEFCRTDYVFMESELEAIVAKHRNETGMKPS